MATMHLIGNSEVRKTPSAVGNPTSSGFPAHNLDFFGCRLELFLATLLFNISVDDNAEIAVAKDEYSSMIAIVCDDNCFLALFSLNTMRWKLSLHIV